MRANTFIALALMAIMSVPGLSQAERGPTGMWNAKDFGAVGDGATDDTAAIQAALDEAGGAGGGIVSLPTGTYLVATHLAIPDNVTLEGVFTAPTAWSQNKGTTLLAVEGEGSEDGPAFITLGTNSVLKGVTVFYPNQNDPANLKLYPWCVACRGGDNPTILDCLLVNPYNGVDFGTHPSGRHLIRNLYGQPLRRGIFVDKCYDVGRIENVHFWPFWNWAGPEIRDWLAANGEAFIFARTDWEYVLNPFVFGYHIGYRFTASEAGAANGNFLGIGADATQHAVWVDECQPMGLLITNGEFVSMLGDDPVSVVVAPNCTGDVSLTNCAFWGPSRQLLRHEGSGTVTLSACNFRDWDCRGEGRPALEALGGQLVVQGCNFSKAAPHVHLGTDVLSAAIVGNRVAGPLRMTNESIGSVQVGLNAETNVSKGDIALGPHNKSRFVTQWDGPDCTTEAREVDGRSCRVTTSRYILFGVDDGLASGGSNPRVSVEMDYYDEGTGEFFLEYDSSDQSVLIVPDRPGAFRGSEHVSLGDTRQWKTAVFEIDDALFVGRCNGGDFRITVPEGTLAVSAVRVARR